ncbi:hypothetical protein ACFL3I_10235 [Pseudomonadota bacterium]
MVQSVLSISLADGMTGMTENVFLNIKNKSKTITAEIEVGDDGGGLAGGGNFTLYVNDVKVAEGRDNSL